MRHTYGSSAFVVCVIAKLGCTGHPLTVPPAKDAGRTEAAGGSTAVGGSPTEGSPAEGGASGARGPKPTITAIVAGNNHTCALVNGGVRCWGESTFSELGDESKDDSPVPVVVAGLEVDVQAIFAGGTQTCASLSTAAECWGAYDKWNGTRGSPTPAQVPGLSTGVQDIVLGSFVTCALVDGTVRCWARAPGPQDLRDGSSGDGGVPAAVSGLTSGARAIAAGMYHVCVLVNGGVQCWGSNEFGQLGNNSKSDSTVPVAVSGLGSGVQAIAAGWYYTCALVNGGVQCWGDNYCGQLGNNLTEDLRRYPVAVPKLASGVQAIAAGGRHTCVLVDGGVKCCLVTRIGGLKAWAREAYRADETRRS
jgi:alpha-tubulin suppressor-like RCC1 family protein